MPREHQGQATEPTKSARLDQLPADGPAQVPGWLVECLRLGVGHASTVRPDPSTLGALRRARVAYASRRRRGDALPLDAWGRPEDDQAVIVVASWSYLGSGYQSTGEAWLAASAAARAREARRIAKEELRTMTMTAA